MVDDKKRESREDELSEEELGKARGGALKKLALGDQPFTPHSAILPYIEQDN